MAVTCIVSGGQTGADRGGLDAAIDLGIRHDGYCPRGRKAEDGRIPDKYLLKETIEDTYPPRTRKNVFMADGSVVFNRGLAERGSLLTIRTALVAKTPLLVVDFDKTSDPDAIEALRTFTLRNSIKTLNVAGSRESRDPGIYSRVYRVVRFAVGWR